MTSDGVLIDLTLPTPKNDDYLSSLTRSNSTLTNVNVSISNLKSLKENQTSSPITFICSEEYLTSRWEEYEDQESGMVKYDWCVGTAKASCDVVTICVLDGMVIFATYADCDLREQRKITRGDQVENGGDLVVWTFRTLSSLRFHSQHRLSSKWTMSLCVIPTRSRGQSFISMLHTKNSRTKSSEPYRTA